MASENLDSPSGTRARRVLDYEGERAADELAGRTVWCASGLSGSLGVAQSLRACLEWLGEGSVAARGLEVAAEAPLRRLAERLEAMIHGVATAAEALGPSEREILADGRGVSEELVGDGVAPATWSCSMTR